MNLMTDDERLLAHARDLLRTAANDGYLTHTAFLDLHQRSVLQALERECGRDVRLLFYGGFPDAERTVAVFLPAFYEAEDAQSFFAAQPELQPLSLLRFEKDRFSMLSHRDYLGALMGLGIKRELVGDLVVDDGGAFVVCLKTAQPFLLEHLTSAGRATLVGRPARFSELLQREEQFSEQFASVASLRLDSVLGAAFGLSRSKAAAAIESGAVYLNSLQTFKPDARVDVGDKLVLRGKGKAVLAEVRGESKKRRTHIVIKKYQ